MRFLPTDEQQDIIHEFRGGENFIVEALAGTGKTSTDVLMAEEAKDESVLYVAYNSNIALEARGKFPRNTDCRTAHSLAFRTVGIKYKPRLDQKKKMTARQTASILGIRGHFVLDDVHNLTLNPRKLARLAADTVQKFCYSADMQIEAKHVPYVKGTDYDTMNDLRQFILPYARRIWQDICDPNGKFRFIHDHYLKLFQIGWNQSKREAMGPPKLPFEVVLFDEAQDSNPCTGALLTAQTHAQLVAVGDRNQQIYGWRGAEDAMQTWPTEIRKFLTKSFRFGPAIADEANVWLELLDAPTRLRGHEPVGSTVGSLELDEADAVLCRTNAGALSVAIEAITELNLRTAIVGGTVEMQQFAESVLILQANDTLSEDMRQEPTHPDLFQFSTWQQVQEYASEEGDDMDPDLKKMMKLVDDNGADVIKRICSSVVKEKDDPQLTISTAHKAKGREWGKVKIHNDFTAPEDNDDEDKTNAFMSSEAMLAYVAVTRAMGKLDATNLQWAKTMLANKAPKEYMPEATKENVKQWKEAVKRGKEEVK